MNPKSKLLLLTSVASLALGAVGTPNSAMATTHTFTASDAPLIVTSTGEGEHRFTLGGVMFECATVTASGQVLGNSVDHVQVRPVFGNCKLTAGESEVAVTIANHGCGWTLDSDTTTSPHFPGQEHALVSLACEHAHKITISMPGCTIAFGDTHPPSQATVNQNLSGVTRTAGGKEITTSWTVRTLAYTTAGMSCALFGLPGTSTNGQYDGAWISRGYKHLGFTGNTTTGFTATEGAQLSIGLTTP